ncbi:hypothetical protein [uncultured Allofournierella sp.]|uniref:hypothetical protein n=1 Tax=uncultured Allofournierella sp. TaxID=1940258 RepID=UPI003750C241
MLKNLYILSGTDAFTKGGLDNVALTENAVCLEQAAGGYLQYGCFTSPEIRFPAFRQLGISWNAQTPPGTVVEAQARVLVDGEWTGWLSFGKWSPHIARESIQQAQAKPAYIEGDTLHIPAGRATQAQMRIYLYTSDVHITPLVRLLAASVRPVEWHHQEAQPYGRLLRLPAYSEKNRDPHFEGTMSAPIALASMINRWGKDALPEELAWGMYDHGAGNCFNHAFLVALASSYGYQGYRAYLTPEEIWKQVKLGNSVAVRVRYASSPEQAAEKGLPYLPGSFETAVDQCMSIRGFELENDKVYVLVNDSLAPTDRQAEHRYLAQEFWAVYTGDAVVITGKQKEPEVGCPHRQHCHLRILEQAGCYAFEDLEGELLELPASQKGTLACTVADGVARATTGHKTFHYLEQSPEGAVQIPAQLLGQGKITVYSIDSAGNALVAELKGS